MTNYIYGLLHPVTQELRYIGKTNNLTKRYQAHCRSTGKTYKDKWVRSLHKQGLQPELLILEECSGNDWVEAEQFYISYFSSIGANICNLTLGGEGTVGHKHTTDSKQLMRQAKLGKALSESHKQAVSSSMRGKSKQYRNGKAKVYLVTTPTGHQTIVLSLPRYCALLGLNRSHMTKVARGTLKSHKGYQVKCLT